MPRNLPIRLADVADGRDNNFDVLRLVAASMVLVSHAFPLTDSSEPLASVGGPTLGALGVALFFSMSGLLIAKSWTWQPQLRQFVTKRALRIMPALVVVMLLTTLVLGPLVTTEPLQSYFTSSEVWIYLVRGSFLITFDGTLPGVFESNPYPSAVNGSLWTLPLEVIAYALVAMLGILGVLGRPRVVLGAAVASLAAVVLFQNTALAPAIDLYAYFLMGTAMYVWRASIPLSWPAAGAGVAMWILAFNSPALAVVGALVLPYVVMVLAYRTPRGLRRITAAGDVSYGMYVFAFPIQQVVMVALPEAGPLLNIAIALPVTWVLGFASWKLVEAPVLARKSRSVASDPERSATAKTVTVG